MSGFVLALLLAIVIHLFQSAEVGGRWVAIFGGLLMIGVPSSP